MAPRESGLGSVSIGPVHSYSRTTRGQTDHYPGGADEAPIMTGRRNRQRGGSSLIEFTLVGIPIIFVLISTFEMSRGMWLYHTLAYAAREGTRYAIVHGVN